MHPITKRDNLIVTGGLGYIGSHIITELLTETVSKIGFNQIIIVDNLAGSNEEVYESIKRFPGGR